MTMTVEELINALKLEEGTLDVKVLIDAAEYQYDVMDVDHQSYPKRVVFINCKSKSK